MTHYSCRCKKREEFKKVWVDYINESNGIKEMKKEQKQQTNKNAMTTTQKTSKANKKVTAN